MFNKADQKVMLLPKQYQNTLEYTAGFTTNLSPHNCTHFDKPATIVFNEGCFIKIRHTNSLQHLNQTK